jgi:hypothetical protein
MQCSKAVGLPVDEVCTFHQLRVPIVDAILSKTIKDVVIAELLVCSIHQ